METQPIVTTVVALPGMPPMRVTITQAVAASGTAGQYIVSGPYREDVLHRDYFAALRAYSAIVDAILASS